MRLWQQQPLSNRYISDRFLPDKAIDLVDEACALIKTELDSMPTELDELRRRVMQLEIEEGRGTEKGKFALKKEEDRLSRASGTSAGRTGRTKRRICRQESTVGE